MFHSVATRMSSMNSGTVFGPMRSSRTSPPSGRGPYSTSRSRMGSKAVAGSVGLPTATFGLESSSGATPLAGVALGAPLTIPCGAFFLFLSRPLTTRFLGAGWTSVSFSRVWRIAGVFPSGCAPSAGVFSRVDPKRPPSSLNLEPRSSSTRLPPESIWGSSTGTPGRGRGDVGDCSWAGTPLVQNSAPTSTHIAIRLRITLIEIPQPKSHSPDGRFLFDSTNPIRFAILAHMGTSAGT